MLDVANGWLKKYFEKQESYFNGYFNYKPAKTLQLSKMKTWGFVADVFFYLPFKKIPH